MADFEAADHRAHSPRRRNGRRSPAHLRARLLGGGRPKTSVIDQHGSLSIAKFPKETRDYSIETWEEIALRPASKAGIAPRNTN